MFGEEVYSVISKILAHPHTVVKVLIVLFFLPFIFGPASIDLVDWGVVNTFKITAIVIGIIYFTLRRYTYKRQGQDEF